MLIVLKPNGKDTHHLWMDLQRFGEIAVTDFIDEVFVTFDLKDGMDIDAIIETCNQYSEEVTADEAQ
jgi:hypothetical protein